MIARTVEQLQAQLYRVLPEDLRGEPGTRLEAVWYGLSRVLEHCEGFGAALLPQATILQGEDLWLRLHARTLGVKQVDGETDAQLHVRMQNTQDRVTPAAILAYVNALLATVTPETALLLERPQSWVLEDGAVEEWPVGGLWNAYVVALPGLPVQANGWALEEGSLVETCLEGSVRHALYAVLEVAVQESTAAGIRVEYTLKKGTT